MQTLMTGSVYFVCYIIIYCDFCTIGNDFPISSDRRVIVFKFSAICFYDLIFWHWEK